MALGVSLSYLYLPPTGSPQILSPVPEGYLKILPDFPESNVNNAMAKDELVLTGTFPDFWENLSV